MKINRKKYFRNTLLATIAVLCVSMLVVDTIVYQYHKNTLYTEFTESKQQQLNLIAILSIGASIEHDNAEINRLITEWGQEVECIVDIQATKSDGTMLARYQRGYPAKESVVVEWKNGSDYVDFEKFSLMADTHAVRDELNILLIQIVAISMIVAMMIALTISIVMRRLAIAPLKEEIAKRKELLVKMRWISKENKLLLESAGEGIFSLRGDAICTFINDAALAFLGFKRDEIIGQNIHDLIHHTGPDGNQSTEADCQIISSLKSGNGVVVNEDLFWRKDGTSFPVMYSSFPMEEGEMHTGVVVVFHDITEQQETLSILEHQATHDLLTGLLNRREFERRLERAVDTARQEHKQHVLFYMDMDNFKPVNDVAGHAAGDELLRRIANRMSFLIRARDTLGRFGGDEFAVLLENCSMEVAMRIAGEIIDAVCSDVFTWDGNRFVVGISIGIVEVNSGCAGPDAVMDAADGACYMAKQLGGCQIQIWSPELLLNGKVH